MSKYLLNNIDRKMNDEWFREIEEEDASTSKTITTIQDDPTYSYDFFIPREYDIVPFPQKWPKSKKTRIMVGGIDSPFYDKFKEKAEVIFFDTFWLYESARELDVEEYNKDSGDLKYLFTTLINRSKIHRRILMKELDNFSLLNDKTRYSFLNPIKEGQEETVIWHNEREQKFIPSQEWISDGYNYEQPSFEWKPPIETKQSLIQIVAETADKDVSFVTEKTWIPLLLGIPFVVVANKNFHKDLYDTFGIEMYDEIIDYHFDSIPDIEMRIHTLVKEINKLRYQNWHELRKKISKKAKRNQEIVHKLIESGKSVPNIETPWESDWDWIVKAGQDRVKKGGFIKNLV